MANVVKIHCSCCGRYVPIIVELTSGNKMCGNIVCPKCHSTITPFTADEPGEYDIVKKLRPIIEEGIDDG